MKLLNKSDVLPVTSIQDFFGISVVEAVSAGVYPIVPSRLSYPEILDEDNNPEIFYSDYNQCYDLLLQYLNDYKVSQKFTSKFEKLVNRFDWGNIIKKYDQKFEKLYEN